MKLDPNRRQFLKNATRTVAGICGVGVILGLQQQQANAKEGVALRPPGALPEKTFSGLYSLWAVRTGLSVRYVAFG
ncbi:quinol dehydrogenase periplasmic component [Actinobacillus equuli]|nr:quinol dehydrogenase periplasmic component [Actinobacillus equuli]